MAPASADGRSAQNKPPRPRPTAKEAKDKGMRKRPRRPVPVGHCRALPDQLEDPNEYGVRTYGRKKRVRSGSEEAEDDENLPEEVSARIMREARAQQEEVEAEGDPLRQAAASAGGRSLAASARDSDSDSDGGGYGSDGGASVGAWDDGEVEVSVEDERAMAAFMAPGGGQANRTLADIIMDKIRAQQAASGQPPPSEAADPTALVPGGLDPRVVAVYQGVGQLLSRYTTGKIPKAFKIIPGLRNWEEVLFLTDVPGWTPHAVYQATRLFVSSLNSRLAQRFVAIVLLPHVRRDIRDNKRLHFALFQSLKKACYKPDAFYKGFLLPLCAAGDCSLREAVIVSAVLRRMSLPVLHSAAALLRIADMEYSGTNSFFIQVLLNKKYALPYRVVDALVDHFVRFADDPREMPVVWHQSLLAFLQRYKHEVRAEDRPPLKELLRKQWHHQVTPELHRELDAARERGAKPPPDAAAAPLPGGAGCGEDPRNLAPVVLMEED